MIERAVAGYSRGALMSEFLPCPKELTESPAPFRDGNGDHDALIAKYGAADWYSWAVKNWGTKWDVGGENEYAHRADENTVTLVFDSAWAPPVQFYRHLVELGFDVQGSYNEPGMCFAGVVESSNGELFDDYYEYAQMSADEVDDTLPPQLNEDYGISDYIRECEEEENEEE